MEDNNTSEKIDAMSSNGRIKGKLSLLGPFRRNSRKTSLILVLIITVIAIMSWYFLIYQDSRNSPAKTRDYSFDSQPSARFMAHHWLEGSGQSNGFFFDIPWDDFLYTDAPYNDTDPRIKQLKNGGEPIYDKGLSVEFGQRIFSSDKVYHQALVAALIVLPSQKNEFNKEGYFKTALNNLSFRLDNKDASKISFTLSGDKTFTNSNIPGNAKIYQLTAETRAANNVDAPIKHMTGELVEIKGKSADYYLLISAIDSVWGSGTKTWQAIKDSIKIDQ